MEMPLSSWHYIANVHAYIYKQNNKQIYRKPLCPMFQYLMTDITKSILRVLNKLLGTSHFQV